MGTISIRFLKVAAPRPAFTRSGRMIAVAVLGVSTVLGASTPQAAEIASSSPPPATAAPAPAALPAPEPQPLGFREFMLDTERTSINTDGLRCVRAVSTPWKEVCFTRYPQGSAERPVLLGAWIDDITLTFISSKLAGIDVSFDGRAFARVVRGLSGSYGPPTQEDQEVYSGGVGISIASPKTVWQTPKGTIIAREMAGQMNSSARFYSNEMLNLINRERQAGLRPKNSGL